MPRRLNFRTYDEALSVLRQSGFTVEAAPGAAHRAIVKKYGCAAVIEQNPLAGAKTGEPGTRIFTRPGYLVGGEIARLVDKGYQKFLKTSKVEIAATADHLKSIHAFSEELREAIGATSLYNEALGTVSDRYVYDRVKDRDQVEPKRPKRPWEQVSVLKPA